ncbi:polyhomeotic-proximal chromatin protein-like [Dermacentor albipictus]|uniref:polyhomeotic-proximal chromatin protein-like n=1 Tax=Dermacentor albipictus TaxID=60249 RepID=UPI0031FCFF14
MAAFNIDYTPASIVTMQSRAAPPYDGNPIEMRRHYFHGTLVDVPVLLGGTPQLFVRIPCGLMMTSLPSGGMDGRPRCRFVVHSVPCYRPALAGSGPFPAVAVPAYGEMALAEPAPIQVPMLAQVSPAIPVQRLGVSDAAAMPVLLTPVSADADAVPQTPALMGTPAARSMKKPSEWTVNEVAEFIRQIPGCARYVRAFRAHQIDGGALLLLCEHHLISVMNISVGAAVKIRSAIRWLRRKENEGPVGPQ